MPQPPPIGIGIIFCVVYEDGRIAKVGVQDLWTTTPRCMTRAEVVRDINRGSVFQTVYRQHEGNWSVTWSRCLTRDRNVALSEDRAQSVLTEPIA
jgi:hypothetical protein